MVYWRDISFSTPNSWQGTIGWSSLVLMATTNLKIVTSDLSGAKEAATVTFGIKGTWYEIDLTDQEEGSLAEVLNTYVQAGRKATNKAEKKRDVPETTVEQRDIIRQWAKSEGLEVMERGRIPKKITAMYIAKHGSLPEAV